MDQYYNKKLGILFGFIFFISTLYFYNDFFYISIFSLFVSIIFLILSFAAPFLLDPLARFWIKLSVILSKIISPIILGIIFFFILTPVSIGLRVFGRDELKIKKSKKKSFWLEKSIRIKGDSFNNQF